MELHQDYPNGVFPFSFGPTDAFVWVFPAAAISGLTQKKTALCCGGAAMLLYILEGTGHAAWEEGAEEYAVGCFLCARRVNTLTLRPGAKTRFLCLTLRNASEFMNAMDARISAPSMRVMNCFWRVLGLAQEGGSISLHEASAAVYALLMEIMAHSPGDEGGSLVRDAIRIMEEEYFLLSGVEDLSDRLGVTKCHFIRAFTASEGISPGQYLRHIRIENAKLLLAFREYSVDAIAGMVGYSGGNYFCKVFRHTEGMSPGQFRAKNRAQADAETNKRLQYVEKYVNM